MKTNSLTKSLLVIVLVLVIVGFFVKKKVGPIDVPNKTPPSIETLSVPEGFGIHVFADNLPSARVIALDSRGRVIVSQTKEGKISVVEDSDNDSIADIQKTLAENLDKPHGLAFDCEENSNKENCLLYVAERGRLGRYQYDLNTATVSSYKKLVDLESSPTDRHFTRTLLFMPPPKEHILLISIGSSCNVCHEEGEMRGKIMAYDTKLGTLKEFAKGLRNAVFMAENLTTGKIFVTEMGRDGLGDNVPPDEINIVEEGKNYGWPICYGGNIHDTDFDKNTYIRNPCMEPFETPSFVDLQAHSAPLGLAFIPKEGWPAEFQNDLLVAFHGSWNRTEPTGYKIMRIKLDGEGKYQGTEDFITGWLKPDGSKSGRPVDIKILPRGMAYISDDSSGTIYRLIKK